MRASLEDVQRVARKHGISEAEATLKLATGEIGTGFISSQKLPFMLVLLGGILSIIGTLLFIRKSFEK